MLAAQEFLFDLNPQLLFDAALLAIAVFFLYMLMSYLLFNPARKLLKDRQDHISSELDEAIIFTSLFFMIFSSFFHVVPHYSCYLIGSV